MVFVRADAHELVLAIGSSLGVDLVDARTRTRLGHLENSPPVTALAVLPGGEFGDRLLIGSHDGTVRLGETRNLHVHDAVDCGPGEIRDFVVHTGRDGSPVVVIARDTGLCLWRPGAKSVEHLAPMPLKGDELPFKVATYTHQGSHYAACATTNGAIAVWDLGAPLSEPSRLDGVHEGPIWSLISVPGRGRSMWIATGGSDQMLRVLAPTVGSGLAIQSEHRTGATIRRLGHVLADGANMVAVASAGGSVSLWRYDGRASAAVVEVTQHGGEVYALACESAEDRVIIASGDFNGRYHITPMTTRVLGNPRELRRINGTIWTVASGSAQGSDFYAFAGVTRTIYVIDPLTGQEISTTPGHQSTVRAMAVAGEPDDPHLITCGADHAVFDWNPLTGEKRAMLRMGHEAEVWAVTTVKHQGRWYVITGGPDGTVRRCLLDEPDRPEILASECGEVQSLTTVASAGQVYVVAGSTQGLLRIPLAGGAVEPVAATPFGAVASIPGGDRPLVVAAHADGTAELYDVIVSVLVRRLDMPLLDLPATGQEVDPVRAGQAGAVRQIRALVCHVTDTGDPIIFGGCDNGDVVKWGLDGRPIGEPARAGNTSVRAIAIARHRSGSGNSAILLTGGHDGILRARPIARDKPLSTGIELSAPINAEAILLPDQPTTADALAREALTRTIVSALENTQPPIVVGINAAWGQGKSSLLRMIRKSVDPVASAASKAKEEGKPRPDTTTHELFHRVAPPAGDAKPGKKERRPAPPPKPRKVTESITPSWAWARLQQRMNESTFPYSMQPTSDRNRVISVWFNPWMYERPEQIWAGLTHEILTAVTDRLPDEQRRMLYFDLNLKRTGATAMRKQIMASLQPRSFRGLAAFIVGTLAMIAAIVAVVVGVVNTGELDKIVGTATVIVLAALGITGRFIWTAVKGFGAWYAPAAVRGPSSGGVLGLLDNSADPLESSHRGYLYLLQHDIREVVDLATENSDLYIFIDDLDRCSPAIVADTIEAINLFLSNAFGPCVFILALDPSTVAAHLESQLSTIGQQAKQDPVSFGHLQHTGWRFMEKIVDLPIRLPRVPDEAVFNYLEQLLLADRRRVAAAANQALAQEAETLRTAVRSPSPAASDATAAPAVQHAEPAAKASAAVPAETAVLVGGIESIPAVRVALHEAVKNLPARNPRQVKTFINLWRFYMVLEYELGVTTTNLTLTRQHSVEMARLVEIMARWPWMLDLLGRRHLVDKKASIVLDALHIAASGEDAAWQEAVAAFQLPVDDADTDALRDLLRREGGDRAQLISIAARYL